MSERDKMVTPERTEVSDLEATAHLREEDGVARKTTRKRKFGPLEGCEIDAFEDDTRAAPVGPTRNAHIRDLHGTPNEGLADDTEDTEPTEVRPQRAA